MRLRLRAGRRTTVLAAAVVVAACLGAAGGGGPAGAQTLPGGTWGQPQAVAGLAALTQTWSYGTSVSCASLGNCTAVGFYQTATGFQPFAVTETDGTWGSAQSLADAPGAPGSVGALLKVSCGAPGYCVASAGAYLATEVKGAWSMRALPTTIGPDTVTGSGINSVACTGAGDCTVVGWFETTSNGSSVRHAFTLDESSGTWGTPQPAAGLPPGGSTSSPTSSSLNSVSCSGPGDCAAGGFYNAGAGSVPFLVSESGGTWGSAQEVPGFAALNSPDGSVASVSCTDASDCAVAGTYGRSTASGSTYYSVFTVDEVDGTWKPATTLDVPAQAGTTFKVAVGCRAAGNCVVTGHMDMTAPSGTVVQVFAAVETKGGAWGQGQALPGIPADDASSFGGLSCVPAGDCTVAGVFVVSGTLQEKVFASTIAADGTIGAAQPVQLGSPAVTALDCPQDGYCTLLENHNGVPQVVTEANPVSVTLTASAPQVSYDSEPAETFTATVSSKAGGTPTGTVAVTGPSGEACTITLSGGTGKYSISPAQFPAGTYTVTGSYNGDLYYVAASGTASLTVAKAKTSTRLTLTTAVITPGQGTMDTVTVTVSQAGSVDPTGVVSVNDGDLVCTVRLVNGSASCLFNADVLIEHSRVLTADYSGDRNFLASTSPPAYLVIAPAGPRLAWPTAGRPAPPVSRWQGRPAPPAG